MLDRIITAGKAFVAFIREDYARIAMIVFVLIALAAVISLTGCAARYTPAMRSDLDAQRADLQKEILDLQTNSQAADDSLTETMKAAFDEMERVALTKTAEGAPAEEIIPAMVGAPVSVIKPVEHVNIDQKPPSEEIPEWMREVGLLVMGMLGLNKWRSFTRGRDLDKRDAQYA